MKGSVIELVMVFVILGVVMIATLLGLKLYNEFTAADVWSDTDAGQAAKGGAEGAILAVNYGMVFLVAGLLISMIVSAFFINSHPIFFVVSLILLIFVILVSGPITNAFMGFAQSDSLATEVDQLDVAVYVVGMIPYIAVIGGFLIMIALYAKPKGGEI